MPDDLISRPAIATRMASALLRVSAILPVLRAPASALAPAPGGAAAPAPAQRAPQPGRGASEAARASRDLRLDFVRGAALFLIFVDHVPGNVLSHVTVQALGFSDAAEIFIFISGYTAALVFGGALEKRGPVIAGAKIFHRVWQLYVAHIFIFLLFTALVSSHALIFDDSMAAKELHVAKFFAEPYKAVIRVMELRFQPNFLDILPLYIVLLAGFPVVLLLLRRDALAALIPSFAIYLAAQLSGLSLYGYPGNHAWLFNPFAWQFLFTIGAACGYARYARRPILPPPLGPLVGPAAIVLAVALAIKMSWTLHAVANDVPALLIGQLWPIDKTNLAPIRLVHFLALAVLVGRFLKADASFLGWRATAPIIRCGQYSLQIFCLGILLSVVGHFVLDEWSHGLLPQLAVNAAGFALMIGTATLIGWYRSIDRATAP
jgi:hypothetical protein